MGIASPGQKTGQPMPRWVTQNTPQVSAISLERCPPSAWNAVRLHGAMLSAITAERCPGSRGIRSRGVATQSQLGLDEGAVGLAQGGRSRGVHRRTSRWPGWSSLSGQRGRIADRIGGHPGAVCIVRRLRWRITLRLQSLDPCADGVAGYAGAALDLALAVARAQKRPDRGLQMWLQDVHLVNPPS